jgi:glycosyltransferase involved in cell wall biosynthesis
MPAVTLIIPCYNARQYLGEAIESALAQTFRDLEIIIVDDGSTDGSHEVAEQCLPRIRLIRQSNKGLAAARNAAIRNSTSQFIAFLDADDLIEPDKIERQVQVLASRPEIGLVHTGMKRFDGAGWVEDWVLPAAEVAQGACGPSLFLRNTVCGASVMVRREVVLEAGFYDERFPSAQDYDFSLRCATVTQFAYIARPLYWWRIGEHQTTKKRGQGAYWHYQAQMKWKRQYPEAYRQIPRRLRRRAVREQFFKDVFYSYWQRDMKFARRLFRIGMRLKPWDLRLYAYYALSLLPAGFFAWRDRTAGGR